MDIKILDSWLKDYLETKATPKQIAEYLSLSGPSVERIEKYGNDFVYDIEVTTNRVDTASVYGIAREASAVLPRFKVAAKLKELPVKNSKNVFSKKVGYISAKVDPRLCSRFTCVLIRDVRIEPSPDYVVKRLESAGVRSINNAVDISNYIMLGLGQPVHTFDYDKIKGQKMVLRESKKGERITTLDDKSFKLPGGDIVIEDGEGRLIDLAGVMGGNLSMVDENTKNVLLFVQTYSPEHIRKTSMTLAQRTNAATIFEKGLDNELVTPAILEAIKLFRELCNGVSEKEILDIYPAPYKTKSISVSEEFIVKRLGIQIPKREVSQYLETLEIKNKWRGDTLTAEIPSFRAKDLLGAEDLVEEVARIYGYHNLPSIIMATSIPERSPDKKFELEENIKNYLSGWGGVEIYTLSLVTKDMAGENGIRLKNSLGEATEYLRTSLMPSLAESALENLKTTSSFHLFELSNVYHKTKNDLPKEVLMLAGIFAGYDYRDAKGVVEAFLEKLNISAEFMAEDSQGLSASKSLIIKSGKEVLGRLGFPANSDLIYYEFEFSKLFSNHKNIGSFSPISKYPAQIEDITFNLSEKTHVGEVLSAIRASKKVSAAELKTVYERSYSFRIWYQDSTQTLTDSEVETLRNLVVSTVKSKFGGNVKG